MSTQDRLTSVRGRLVALLEVIERRELDTIALERMLDAFTREMQLLREQEPAADDASIAPMAKHVERLLAVALDRCEREKNEIADLLERTRAARKRMSFYSGGGPTGESCDVKS